MWNEGWENIFKTRDWGKYPSIEVVRFVSRNFKPTPTSSPKILEIGSGTGANLWFMAREGYDTYGVDGSPTAVKKCLEYLAKENLKADVRVGDVGVLDFPNEYFDCVIDCECLYSNSYEDSQKIIKEIHRVLKKGGKFFSQTFKTGTTGDGNGVRFKQEKNTYTELHSGILKNECGLIRFTDADDIKYLYGSLFEVYEQDYILRSDKNQKYEINEWLISCTKTKGL